MATQELLTVSEAAAMLRRSKSTLDVWRCRLTGPRYLKLHGKIFYRLSDLAAFIEAAVIDPATLPEKVARPRRAAITRKCGVSALKQYEVFPPLPQRRVPKGQTVPASIRP